MRGLGILYRLVRCKPLLRKLKVRVVKSFPGGPCSRCLSALFISLPRYFECPLELFADRSEGGIIKLREEALAEFFFVDVRVRHSLANIDVHALLRGRFSECITLYGHIRPAARQKNRLAN